MTGRTTAPGMLIVLEGPDGVGKSTVSTAIANHLKANGLPAMLLTFPGRQSGTLGSLVYEIHHHPAHFGLTAVTPAGKQALHIAAHLDAIERTIVPMLRAGRHVVLDRFWWSTWVYGAVGGVDRRTLRRMIALELAQWGNVRPALAILLRRQAPINREHDAAEWSHLRREYALLARREKHRYPVLVIENSGSLQETLTRITTEVLGRLASPREGRAQDSPSGPDELQLESAAKLVTTDQQFDRRSILARISPARPSAVYDTYWRFAAERQRIFFKRSEGSPPPWTDDPVLARYKFTNAYRASDRTSQYLIRSVIYRDDLPASDEEVFFRILIFKLFNKIETWELLEKELRGITHADYRFERYDSVLSRALGAGTRVYSAAYIMPPGRRVFGESVKHRNHLQLLELMMRDELAKRLADAPSMQRGFELLRGYPTIGDFLAYQFITDINYSEITHFTEMEFVVPGPGARDGICKCFLDRGGLNEPEIIRFVADRQENEFARLGLEFRSLWGRPLQLIDCQNLFCEVDKYARVVHPDVAGFSGRARIKQLFTPRETSVEYWYPPKWRIAGADGMVAAVASR